MVMSAISELDGAKIMYSGSVEETNKCHHKNNQNDVTLTTNMKKVVRVILMYNYDSLFNQKLANLVSI